jgi:hypothetical protein
MSKKKKTKKRRLQAPAAAVHGTPAAPSPGVTASSESASVATASIDRSKPSAEAVDPRVAYVGNDLRRIGIIGGLCILLELVLWYLLSHTNLGDAVYHLIKL